MNRNAIRGASLLDQKQPGWYREVDLADLDMKSPSMCIIGQVYPRQSFTEMVEVLSDEWEYTRLLGFVDHYGFDLPRPVERQEDWADLRAAWIQEIQFRLDADTVVAEFSRVCNTEGLKT